MSNVDEYPVLLITHCPTHQLLQCYSNKKLHTQPSYHLYTSDII